MTSQLRSELSWEGRVNVRSLGGGIVRSDNVRKLSDAGWQAAWEHGVRTVIDLRSEPGCADDPPLRDGVEYVRIGLSDFDRPQREDPEDRTEALRLWYWEHLEHNTAGIAAVFRVLADAEGGVLVHCLGGRTAPGSSRCSCFACAARRSRRSRRTTCSASRTCGGSSR